MAKYDIFFLLFSEITHAILKTFSDYGLMVAVRIKNRLLGFLDDIFRDAA